MKLTPKFATLLVMLMFGCAAVLTSDNFSWADDEPSPAEAPAAESPDEELEVPADDEQPAEKEGEPAEEENGGEDALAEAIDARISATSLDDLGRAILLLETALLKGLDDDNSKFAKQMLGSARLERATKVSTLILDASPPNPQWPQLRRIALSDLGKAVEVQPKLAAAYLLTARLQALPGGDDAAALKAANAAVENADPQDNRFASQAFMVRGDLQEDKEKQLSDYDQALKALPSNVEALRSRGLHFLASEKYKQAQQDFDAALKIDPENARTLEALGVVLFMKDKLDGAEKRLTQAIELDPNSPLAYTYRARVFALQKKNEKALADVNAALELAPSAASLMMLRAQIHERAGESEKALTDIESLLEQQPELYEAILMKAILLASTGKPADGLDYLRAEIEKHPDNLELKSQLAAFYLSEDNTDEALKVYSEIIKKVPDDVSALRGRGDAYLGVGKLKEAIADYKKALEIDPANSGVLNNYAWVLATAPDEKVRQGKRAIELANKAGELTEFDQPHILSTIAAAYAEAGDWEKAVEWSGKAAEMGEGEMKVQLEAEYEAFKKKKPWREVNHPDGSRSSGPEGDLKKEE